MATFSQQLQESRRRQALGQRVAPKSAEPQTGASAGGGASGGAAGNFRVGTLTGRPGSTQQTAATGQSPASATLGGASALSGQGAPSGGHGGGLEDAYRERYSAMLAIHQQRMDALNAERGLYSPEALAQERLRMAMRVKEGQDRKFAEYSGADYGPISWTERRAGAERSVTLQPGSPEWYQYLYNKKLQQFPLGLGAGGEAAGDGLSGPADGASVGGFGGDGDSFA